MPVIAVIIRRTIFFPPYFSAWPVRTIIATGYDVLHSIILDRLSPLFSRFLAAILPLFCRFFAAFLPLSFPIHPVSAN
jgi:hypothetical protein